MGFLSKMECSALTRAQERGDYGKNARRAVDHTGSLLAGDGTKHLKP